MTQELRQQVLLGFAIHIVVIAEILIGESNRCRHQFFKVGDAVFAFFFILVMRFEAG